MLATYEKRFLLLIALLHLTAQSIHAYSHGAAGVVNTLWQLVYIFFVITLLPLIAVYVAYAKSISKGAFLFALAMLAAFVFGYLFHFVLETPDLHTNVAGTHRQTFFHSAIILSILEFAGFLFGLFLRFRPWATR